MLATGATGLPDYRFGKFACVPSNGSKDSALEVKQWEDIGNQRILNTCINFECSNGKINIHTRTMQPSLQSSIFHAALLTLECGGESMVVKKEGDDLMKCSLSL